MRYMLLDRIVTLRPPELATAVKCVSLADDVFVDHFPGHPVMPGALLLEALAQLGVVLEAIGVAAGEDGGQVRGLAHVDGKLAVEAELTFALIPITNARLIERRREVLQTWLSGS